MIEQILYPLISRKAIIKAQVIYRYIVFLFSKIKFTDDHVMNDHKKCLGKSTTEFSFVYSINYTTQNESLKYVIKHILIIKQYKF